ncbi:TPA: hypothetical protein NNM78_006415, partial [Pseudomonas aeruginosa]|nr:hypothetical protein [Pseudomonas aeruginosa]
METLLERLQELSDLLEPGRQIKRTLAGIRRQIKNQLITRADLEDLVCSHVLNTGWWEEQTARTYKIACIYTAIAQIKLENNEAVGAMSAMLEASSYYGLSAGFSHPRRIAAERKARDGAIAKAENRRQKTEKLIELLEYHKPKGGWPGKNETAKLIAPYFKIFLTQALEQP